MDTEVWGTGTPVVLVHGAITNGTASWSKQRPLGDNWQLVVINRPGFVPNPAIERCDFEVDARALVELLEQSAHLVGHSYGGLIALLASTYRPESVRSLTLIEPPVMSLLRGEPEVEETIATHIELLDTHRMDPREFFSAFTANLGGDPARVPATLPPDLSQHVELLMNERFPWEAKIPTAALSTANFPKLVVSGGHSPMQERMCDVLASEIGAHRENIPGTGHNVQRAPGFNEVLSHFWQESETRQAG